MFGCMQCKAVLGKLHGAVNKDGRQIAELFMELPKRSEMPDYYKVIARPISAQAIEERLDRFDYPSVSEFAADVHLMIDNAARYHSDSLEVCSSALCNRLSTSHYRHWFPFELNVSSVSGLSLRDTHLDRLSIVSFFDVKYTSF